MYLSQLMQAEREFTKLAEIKNQRSQDQSLNLFYRNKNLYEYYKARRERDSYRREIEELAEEHFPLHLELDIHELISCARS